MKFQAARTKDLLWPDLGGVGAAVVGHYASRGIDYARGLTTPFKRFQDWVALGMGVGSWAMYCYNKAPDFAESWFGSNVTLVMEGAADALIGTPEERFAGLRSRRKIEGEPKEELPPGQGNQPPKGGGALAWPSFVPGTVVGAGLE